MLSLLLLPFIRLQPYMLVGFDIPDYVVMNDGLYLFFAPFNMTTFSSRFFRFIESKNVKLGYYLTVGSCHFCLESTDYSDSLTCCKKNQPLSVWKFSQSPAFLSKVSFLTISILNKHKELLCLIYDKMNRKLMLGLCNAEDTQQRFKVMNNIKTEYDLQKEEKEKKEAEAKIKAEKENEKEIAERMQAEAEKREKLRKKKEEKRLEAEAIAKAKQDKENEDYEEMKEKEKEEKEALELEMELREKEEKEKVEAEREERKKLEELNREEEEEKEKKEAERKENERKADEERKEKEAEAKGAEGYEGEEGKGGLEGGYEEGEGKADVGGLGGKTEGAVVGGDREGLTDKNGLAGEKNLADEGNVAGQNAGEGSFGVKRGEDLTGQGQASGVKGVLSAGGEGKGLQAGGENEIEGNANNGIKELDYAQLKGAQKAKNNKKDLPSNIPITYGARAHKKNQLILEELPAPPVRPGRPPIITIKPGEKPKINMAQKANLHLLNAGMAKGPGFGALGLGGKAGIKFDMDKHGGMQNMTKNLAVDKDDLQAELKGKEVKRRFKVGRDKSGERVVYYRCRKGIEGKGIGDCCTKSVGDITEICADD